MVSACGSGDHIAPPAVVNDFVVRDQPIPATSLNGNPLDEEARLYDLHVGQEYSFPGRPGVSGFTLIAAEVGSDWVKVVLRYPNGDRFDFRLRQGASGWSNRGRLESALLDRVYQRAGAEAGDPNTVVRLSIALALPGWQSDFDLDNSSVERARYFADRPIGTETVVDLRLGGPSKHAWYSVVGTEDSRDPSHVEIGFWPNNPMGRPELGLAFGLSMGVGDSVTIGSLGTITLIADKGRGDDRTFGYRMAWLPR
ncbi:MAG: hypothetical protein QM634_10420 [Gordonia sp. (in: high G+C Gram-positive bacteria)]